MRIRCVCIRHTKIFAKLSIPTTAKYGGRVDRHHATQGCVPSSAMDTPPVHRFIPLSSTWIQVPQAKKVYLVSGGSENPPPKSRPVKPGHLASSPKRKIAPPMHNRSIALLPMPGGPDRTARRAHRLEAHPETQLPMRQRRPLPKVPGVFCRVASLAVFGAG